MAFQKMIKTGEPVLSRTINIYPYLIHPHLFGFVKYKPGLVSIPRDVN